MAADLEREKREAERRRVHALAAKEGSLYECPCCCTDSAVGNMVQCSEGHLFCFLCLQ
eukprot:gene1998-2374_t